MACNLRQYLCGNEQQGDVICITATHYRDEGEPGECEGGESLTKGCGDQGKELIQCDISTRGKSDPLKRGALPMWETKQEGACEITQWEGEQNMGHST